MSNSFSLVQGLPTSNVRLTVFEDLQCPDCRAFHRMVEEQVLPEFGGRIAVEHRDFPLPKHSWARQAASVARFFQRIGPEIGLAFRRDILHDLSQIRLDYLGAWVRAFARRTGQPEAPAEAAMADPKLAAEVEADYQMGLQRGVVKTPTAFIGSTAFIERFPYEDLAAAIEASLAGESR